MNSLTPDEKHLQLISKWGCDGSSCHKDYHQTFEDKDTSDASMFVTSFVPLQMIMNNKKNGKIPDLHLFGFADQ